MKKGFAVCMIAFVLFSCSLNDDGVHSEASIIGTWKLLSGTTIKGMDTTFVDYTKGQEMIKIITPTHFSFIRHDLNHGKDSSAVFSAGAGRVTVKDNKYTEQLDYFNVREWEGGKFEFDYKINGDTLIITGIEKIEKLGVDQLNIEKYVRVK